MKRLIKFLVPVLILIPACGDDVEDGTNADIIRTNNNKSIYPEVIREFGHIYNCLIYENDFEDEGGLWCERVENAG